MIEQGTIAFDLDGTLAYYDHWRGIEHIGTPIKNIIDLAKKYIREGYKVIIFTARAEEPKSIPYIKQWCINVGLGELEVTNKKTGDIIKYYDDRAVSVVENQGIIR